MNSYDVKLLVNRMHDKIRSDDPRLQRSVLINHADGSALFFSNAFMVRYHNWLLVFTEHQGSHYFCINELNYYQQLLPIADTIELVNDNGDLVATLNCSYCHNVIKVQDICSIHDEEGNRIDADICEGCEEMYLKKFDDPVDQLDIIDAIDVL